MRAPERPAARPLPAALAGTAGRHDDDPPPYPAAAATFTGRAFDGITIQARAPRFLAAYASAAAWFPEEWVTTPRATSSAVSEKTLLVAPRILNDPVF